MQQISQLNSQTQLLKNQKEKQTFLELKSHLQTQLILFHPRCCYCQAQYQLLKQNEKKYLPQLAQLICTNVQCNHNLQDQNQKQSRNENQKLQKKDLFKSLKDINAFLCTKQKCRDQHLQCTLVNFKYFKNILMKQKMKSNEIQKQFFQQYKKTIDQIIDDLSNFKEFLFQIQEGLKFGFLSWDFLKAYTECKNNNGIYTDNYKDIVSNIVSNIQTPNSIFAQMKNRIQNFMNEIDQKRNKKIQKIMNHLDQIQEKFRGQTNSDSNSQSQSSEQTEGQWQYSKNQQTQKKLIQRKPTGLQFDENITKQLFEKKYNLDSKNKIQFQQTGTVYLTAVLQYISAQILQLSGNQAQKKSKKIISAKDIMIAIKKDQQLYQSMKQTLTYKKYMPKYLKNEKQKIEQQKRDKKKGNKEQDSWESDQDAVQ